ncbi:DNA helicase [Kroppenstedtia guangzhouensis]|uniref:DNA 3'-5' helicase n=1 Tax=Kroppenstedtia guangzhouensis TaxID=1274356 RepID=A0ABQ1GGM0_9BACL|nr:DEAD/DEAH box helicase [Kroppenstedtia guangzhouensis]GGA43268.1 DNA helicase [Kroppenstedtia guangzhouensis]
MGQGEPRYSLLLFVSDVEEGLFEDVVDRVRCGIKVWLFAMDSLEALEKTAEWQHLKKAGMLRWWEVPFQSNFAGIRAQFVDGQVTDSVLYEYLCRETDFNREQYEVEHSDPKAHLLVTAGAGTGKTTVLIDRLLFLCHTDPEFSFDSTVMITFTNLASLEMRKRLGKRLMTYFEVTRNPRYLGWLDETRDLFLSTIHSFAKTLLEEGGTAAGLPVGLQLRSFREQKNRWIETCVDEFAEQHPEVFRSFRWIPHHQLVHALLRIHEAVENRSLTLEELSTLEWGEDESGFHHLVQYVLVQLSMKLERVKEENGELELSDLIRRLSSLKGNFGLFGDRRVNHLFVDEFQDTDTVQVDLLLWMQGQWDCRVLAVGDVKQSIYRFRGADYTSFQQLQEGLQHRPRSVVKKGLVKNYRTIRPLLEEMSPLFENWGRRVKGFMYERKDQLEGMNRGDGPGLILKDLKLKATFRELLGELQGTDTCILVRSNREVEEMIKQLEEWGFFCEGGIQGNFFRSLPVRELYLLVSLLTRPVTPSLAYAFHCSSFGAGELGNSLILKDFHPDHPSFLTLWEKHPESRWVRELRKQALEQPILPLLRKAVREIRPQDRLACRLYQEWVRRFPDRDPADFQKEAVTRRLEYEAGLDHLFFLLQREFTDAVATPARVERMLRLHILTDREESPVTIAAEKREHRFRCMTVHMAKGLEFDYVILPRTDFAFTVAGRPQVWLAREGERWKLGYRLGLDTRTIRNSLFEDLRHQEEEETRGEETRLLYVAMTRAVQGLYVHVSETLSDSSKVNRWVDLLRGGKKSVAVR